MAAALAIKRGASVAEVMNRFGVTRAEVERVCRVVGVECDTSSAPALPRRLSMPPLYDEAVALFCEGASIREIAFKLKVRRVTVVEWMEEWLRRQGHDEE